MSILPPSWGTGLHPLAPCIKHLYLYSNISLQRSYQRMELCLREKSLIYAHNSKVLPVVDRALKRNPEAVIEEVSFLVSNLSLDLSPFAAGSGATFVAMVTPHLASRDERIQNGAIDIIREVAKTVSSSESLVALLKGVAGALSGSHTIQPPLSPSFSIFCFTRN